MFPIYFHFKGVKDTNKLIEDFTNQIEEKQDEETICEEEEQTSISEEDAAIFSEGDVIAILEIASLGIRYPVVEGVSADALNTAIGHLPETAGIGQSGNCVLAGHNGSRHGEFFTHLNEIKKGDEVTLMNVDGEVLDYEVTDFYVVGPYDNSIKNQDEKEELTLFTCAEKGSKRFVVKCIRKEDI
jgi:sortase A